LVHEAELNVSLENLGVEPGKRKLGRVVMQGGLLRRKRPSPFASHLVQPRGLGMVPTRKELFGDDYRLETADSPERPRPSLLAEQQYRAPEGVPKPVPTDLADGIHDRQQVVDEQGPVVIATAR
jgi:hypothetical protein